GALEVLRDAVAAGHVAGGELLDAAGDGLGGLGQRGEDETGDDRVDRHAPAGPGFGLGAGKGGEGGLGGAVDAAVGEGADALLGGDVDDASPAALGHERPEVLAEQVGGGEVDGDGLLVVVLGELGHGLADVVGRVVDQHVDASGLFAHAPHGFPVAEVGGDGGGGDAVP